MQADKVYAILPQTTVFVWIFLLICSGNNELIDDGFKPVMMIAKLRYVRLDNEDKSLVDLVTVSSLHLGNECWQSTNYVPDVKNIDR